MGNPGRKPSFFRRKYLINKKLQLKYAAVIIVGLLLLVGLVEWHIYSTMKVLLPRVGMLEMRQDILAAQYILMAKVFIFMVLFGAGTRCRDEFLILNS